MDRARQYLFVQPEKLLKNVRFQTGFKMFRLGITGNHYMLKYFVTFYNFQLKFFQHSFSKNTVVIRRDSEMLSWLFQHRELGTPVRNCWCFLFSFVDFKEEICYSDYYMFRDAV